jgi:hypothetical protein
MMWRATDSYQALALGDPGAGSPAETKAALLNTIFKIVPMENVNGRTKVEGGDFCERKNGRDRPILLATSSTTLETLAY